MLMLWVSLSVIKDLKRVGKAWKTRKELDVRKLTGQMKMWKKSVEIGLFWQAIKCTNDGRGPKFRQRNCEEDFDKDFGMRKVSAKSATSFILWPETAVAWCLFCLLSVG
jgi:hypothetical protein